VRVKDGLLGRTSGGWMRFMPWGLREETRRQPVVAGDVFLSDKGVVRPSEPQIFVGTADPTAL
jgi:hypothetical protein